MTLVESEIVSQSWCHERRAIYLLNGARTFLSAVGPEPKCAASLTRTSSEGRCCGQGCPRSVRRPYNAPLRTPLPRASLWAALLALAMFCIGCQTPKSLFTASGPGWRVQEGQALWRPSRGSPEIGGDLVLARDNNGCCLIEFSKTPMTLVSVQTTRTNWLIEFPPRRMSFIGRSKPLDHFTWLYLYSALCGEPLPAALVFQPKADGGWRLENTRSGETLEGFLAP